MSVKIKKFIFSSIFYVSAITIVGLVAFQASTYADKQANYHDIAQVQVTVNALKHCLDDADAFDRGRDKYKLTHQQVLYPIKANDASQGNIFERTLFGFETGYWLEKQISGKVTDHKLRCSEQKSKIVQFTASKLGIPLKEILCDKAKGLKTKGVLEPSHRIGPDIDESITCDNFSSGQDYYRAVSSDALAHLKKLYKTWQANNPGAVKWGQLSEDVGPAAYYKYFDSFLAGCTKGGVIEEATGKTTAFNTKWRRLGANGKVKEVKIKKRSDYAKPDCENLIGEMNKHFKKNESAIVQEMVENGANSTTPPVADPGTKESTEEETFTNNCFNQTGAIGWLICPAITLINGALETAYNNLIEPMLQVSPELVQSTGDDAATYQAWSIFRNFANIIFILLFLGVIISQVTGLGIDNYGIKKILPKLIIVAILINLSFYICQLAVDISNLLGYSFRTLFTNLVGNIGDGSSASTAGKVTAGGFSLAVAGAGIFAAFGSATLALIIPLFTTLVSALISILFLFIILVARKSIIILLIAISPVAFALYALPNTNPLFKKWFSLFKTLLIVYPICGLLIGAGALASSVVSRAGAAGQEGVTILVGILIQIVPYFFIPSLVKKSVDGLSGLGSRIAGFNKFSGALNKRAKQGLTEARNRATASKGAWGWRDKLANSKFGKATGYNRRRGAMVAEDFKRRQAELSYDRMNSDNGRATMISSLESKEMEQAIKDEEAAILNDSTLSTSIPAAQAALAEELSRKDPNTNRIKALQNHLSAKGDDGRQAVHSAMESAQASGNVSNKARQAYSQNLMNNWAKEYKANSRSTFDYAKDNQGEEAVGTLAGKAAQSARSLTHSQLASMDEAELGRYANAANSLSAQDQSALLNQVNLALKANSEGRLDIKDKQLVKLKDLQTQLSSSQSNGGGSPSSGPWDDYNEHFLPGDGNN